MPTQQTAGEPSARTARFGGINSRRELIRAITSDDDDVRVAVVLFARSERLLPYYPQCGIRLARFRGIDKTEFLDNRQ
mgnify:CR=1 FL=1